jgi:hypothetical protein
MSIENGPNGQTGPKNENVDVEIVGLVAKKLAVFSI